LAIVSFLVLVFASFLQNTCNAQPAKSPIRDEISYTNDIRPIVNNFCTTCHAGDDPEGEFVLTGYDDVRKHVGKGTLLTRINDPEEPMPQNGLLPKYMRRMFQLWADGGYVNKGTVKPGAERMDYAEFTPPEITPVDVRKEGFEMLEYMQGHWVGSMNLMGQDWRDEMVGGWRDWVCGEMKKLLRSLVC
jgi:hypothetical protein